MWELDYKESWVRKNWCFWTVVLEKTLESPLDCKEIQPVHPKRNQSWVFIGRTDAEAETPILWPPDAKNWLIWKDSRKDWRQEEGGNHRGWDGWMASPTQWIWVCVNSVSWWWTGRPVVLRSMGSDWATELNWTELMGVNTCSFLHWLYCISVKERDSAKFCLVPIVLSQDHFPWRSYLRCFGCSYWSLPCAMCLVALPCPTFQPRGL